VQTAVEQYRQNHAKLRELKAAVPLGEQRLQAITP
jgi:hypothetical protein